VLAKCTTDHVWLTTRYHDKSYKQKMVEDFGIKDQYIVRR